MSDSGRETNIISQQVQKKYEEGQEHVVPIFLNLRGEQPAARGQCSCLRRVVTGASENVARREKCKGGLCEYRTPGSARAGDGIRRRVALYTILNKGAVIYISTYGMYVCVVKTF